MTILGKILIVLNLVAIGAFAWLGAADYAQRRAWAYDAFRWQLLLSGLPLDKAQVDPVANIPEVVLIDKPTLDLLFSGTGQPVQTQMEEVDSLHDRLKTKLAGLPDSSRRQMLSRIMVPLARTGPQREAVTARIQNDKLEDLVGQNGLFERVFEAVKRPTDIVGPDPADAAQTRILDPFEWAFLDIPASQIKNGPQRAAATERRVIAHLLFNAPPEEEQPQRALAVVGLKAYTDEGNEQAYALGDIESGAIARINGLMNDDRALFIARNLEVVKQLQVLEQRLQDEQAELARIKDVQAKNQTLVQARQTDVTNLQARLTQARTDTKKALLALAGEQKLLFEAQRAVGEGQRANERLERELHASENPVPQSPGH